MRRFLVGALAALAMGGTAHAVDYVVVNVSATAMPWLWADGGLNTDYQFGIQDGTGPATFDFADLGIGEGDSYGLLYVGGLINVFGGAPEVDNAGYRGSVFKNDTFGASGAPFPSAYMSSEWGTGPNEGVFLGALVGAFADAGGGVVSPFSLGTVGSDGGSTLFGFSGSLGAGITHVQFGLNDDIFADNTGAFQVCIDRADNACFNEFYGGDPVPEPATWGLMIAGFGLAGAALRRRRTVLA